MFLSKCKLVLVLGLSINCIIGIEFTQNNYKLVPVDDDDDVKPVTLFGATTFVLNLLIGKHKGRSVNLDSILVHIHPKHLALLLQYSGDVSSTNRDVTNKTFLQSFSKFLVSLEAVNDKDIDFGNMDRLLNSVSEYNLKQSNAGNTNNPSKQLQLWISIPATKSITNVVFEVLTKIQHTNSVSAGTVAALLLNYRSLHVTAESLPVIRNDFELTKLLVENMAGNTVKTGIILEVHNCRMFFESSPLSSLKMDHKDELMFISQLHGEAQEIDLTFPLYSCLTSGDFVKAKLSLEISVRVVISLVESTFEFIQPVGSTLEVYSTWAGIASKRMIVKVEIKELSKNATSGESARSQKIDAPWLAQETVFDKDHFGVSIYSTGSTEIMSVIMPHVFYNFRKIIVQNGKVNVVYLKQFVSSMAHFQKSQIRNQMNQGEIKHDDIPAQIFIVANINHENRAQSFDSVKGAMESAMLANTEYPGIATVIFSLNTCDADDITTVKNANETLIRSKFFSLKFLPRLKSLMQAFMEYKRQLRNNLEKVEYPTNVGVISEFCTELAAAGIPSVLPLIIGSNQELEPNLLLFKQTVHISDILEYGATRSASLVIHSTRNCDVMRMYFRSTPMKFNLYVQLTGCNSTQHNHTDIYQLAEVAKFWELLNSWAVKENKTIFMDTAFEYPANLSKQQEGSVRCAKNVDSCGWWKVRRNGSGNDSHEHNWTCEDIKSIAFKMHEELDDFSKNKGNNRRKANEGPDKRKVLMYVLTAAAFFVLGVVVVSTTLVFRYRSKYILSRNEVRSFTRGEPTQNAKNDEMRINGGTGSAYVEPYNRAKYEIARSSFEIDSTKRLGFGEFATVTMGTIKRGNESVQVAVKMTKRRPASSSSHSHYLAVKGLISEIKILSYVGEHRHVIKLEGAYTAKMRSGKILVFLEMCELGSLKKYLTANATSVVEEQGNMEMKDFTLSPEMAEDLCRWSIEIARGMEFLSSKKIVHADLATRNILLNSNKCAKISDFGLSRRLYDYSEYLKTEAGPLPWRWMAPESLRRMIFNEKSDVWAFGVTLWEMYNLGDEPYPGLTWEMNFPSLLERGLRLNEPRHSQKDIYLLMKRCWEFVPAHRPTFAELRTMLKDNTLVTR